MGLRAKLKNMMKIHFDDYINEYIKFTRSTVKYPKKVEFDYLINGIVGEIGEVFGEVGKFYRGDFTRDVLKERVSKEIGDCFWFYFRLIDHLNIPLDFLLPLLNGNFIVITEEYQINKKLKLPRDILFYVSSLYEKKDTLRKESEKMDTLQVQSAAEFIYRTKLVGIFTSLIKLLIYYDLNFFEVLDSNIEKLQNRMNQDTIKGDGNDR